MPLSVVVTGGGTIAPIDDVRAITNASTGRFSAAISEACLERGAQVWHVHAPHAALPFDREARLDLDADFSSEIERLDQLRERYLRHRERLRLIALPTGTVAEYSDALRQALAAGPADLVFLAMAVSDYEPEPLPGKIDSADDELSIRCRRTPKVIQAVRDWCPGAYIVGFKLLSGASEPDLIAAAERACSANRTDVTLANDLRLLREGRHTAHLVRPGHPVVTVESGQNLAGRVVEQIMAWCELRG